MNKFRVFCLLAMAAVVTMPAAVRAAESPVARFISPQTNAVIHLDMTQVDMDAVEAFMQKQMDASQAKSDGSPAAAAKTAADQKDMHKQMDKAKKWVSDFQTAGGKDIYVVVELGGMFQGKPGEMVVPLDAAASPEALAALLNPNPPGANGPPPAMRPTTAVIGQTLVYSTGAMLQQLKAQPPAPAPGATPAQAGTELVDALAADSGSTLQIAGSPASIKNNPMIGMMMMGMAGMRSRGGGQQAAPPLSEPEWSNVTWVLLSVTSPPKESARFVCQCKDADSATALSKLLTKQLQDGFDHPKNKDVDPADRQKLKGAITPVVAGSQVKITLDQDELDNVILPILDKTRMRQQERAKTPPPPVEQPPQPGNQGVPPDNNIGGGM